MPIYLIIGNALAMISVIFVFASVLEKNKTDLIWWQTVQVVFCMLASIALSAYAALVTNCLSLIRNVLAGKNKLTAKMTFLLTVLCIIIGFYVNNKGIIGLLAIIASSSYTVCMYATKNAQQMRYVLLFNSALWLIHDFYIQSYPTAVAGCWLIIWTTTQIIRYRKAH